MSWDGDQGGVPALMDDVSGVFPLLRMRTMYWEQRLTGCLIFIKVCRNGSRLQNKGRLFHCYALFRSLKEITLLYFIACCALLAPVNIFLFNVVPVA